MTSIDHFILVTTVLLMLLVCHITSARAVVTLPDADHMMTVTTLSWNKVSHEAPFRLLGSVSNSDSDTIPQIIYQSGDFGFLLLQSLYHDATSDCYTLTVSLRGTLQIVHFWKAPLGFYRTVNGPYLELEDFESLKAVTALNGTRFLFAEVGDGEWRCVSIHDSGGTYLLIDYRPDGLIESLRDSLSRTAVPTYNNGRIKSLTQKWISRSGPQTRTFLIQ